MIGRIKRKVENVLVRPLVRSWRSYRHRMTYKGLSTQEVFSKIYREGAWGTSDKEGQAFYSGSGSHDTTMVSQYVSSVNDFLKTLPAKPDVVDLGCGDFAVGSQIRPSCANYIACDIVPELIEFDRKRHADLDVDFRVLNLIEDPLPAGEVLFVRQVLQHLSNADIKQFLPKLKDSFKYLVLSEHLPSGTDFPHNNEKPTGHNIRLDTGGGLVLTSPPFNLAVKDERVLCEVTEFNGVIRTTLYTLRD